MKTKLKAETKKKKKKKRKKKREREKTWIRTELKTVGFKRALCVGVCVVHLTAKYFTLLSVCYARVQHTHTHTQTHSVNCLIFAQPTPHRTKEARREQQH